MGPVAFVIDNLAVGGAENVVRQLAGGFACKGVRTFIYCLKRAASPDSAHLHPGVVVREADSRGRDPGLYWRLGAQMRRDGIRLINAHSSAALVAAAPAAKCLGLPLIHTRHGRLMGHPSIYRRAADRLVRCVDRTVIVSESLRNDLPNAAALRRAVHIPNGIDREWVSRGEARRRLQTLCKSRLSGPLILTVGTICPEKNLRGLLRAFARLRAVHADAALVSIGPTRDEAYARAVDTDIRDLRLESSVFMLGPVADAYRQMAGADAFCLSSVREAMPIAVVEAMSQGVPIVATAVGDVGQLEADSSGSPFLIRQGRTGLLVPPDDVPALADGLREVVERPRAAQRRAERAMNEYRSRFTGEHMIARYERVYAECLRPRAAAARRRSIGAPAAGRPQRAEASRRTSVLMIGPPRDRISGMVGVVETLMSGPLRDRYVFHYHATADRPDAPRDACSEKTRRHGMFAGVARPLASALRHLAVLAQMARILRTRRIGIVHIHTCSFFSFYRSLLDLTVARAHGAAVFLHIHGGQFEHFCRGAGRMGRWIIRRGCEAASGVIVLSPRWRRDLAPYMGAASVRVIPNGVAIPPEQSQAAASSREPGPTSRPCTFLYLAPLTTAKGLFDLLDAAANMRRRGIEFEILVVGPDTRDERAAAVSRARAAGLADIIHFRDPITAEDRDRLFASVDCLVHPSHSEALPLTVLEAAIAGLPVIATAVGSLPEALAAEHPSGRAGEGFVTPLVPAQSPVELGEVMAKLAGSPQLRRRISAALQTRVREAFSLERQSEAIARLYESVRQGRRTTMGGRVVVKAMPVTQVDPGSPERPRNAIPMSMSAAAPDPLLTQESAIHA